MAEWEGNDGHGGNRYPPFKRSVCAATAQGIQSVVRGVKRAKTQMELQLHIFVQPGLTIAVELTFPL